MVFFSASLVNQADRYARVEKGQFAEFFGENIVVKLDAAKGQVSGLEMAFRARCAGLAGKR